MRDAQYLEDLKSTEKSKAIMEEEERIFSIWASKQIQDYHNQVYILVIIFLIY
jgi:hypothetical protein